MFKQKLIYVCSPLRGNIEQNIARAREYCRSVIIAGYVPLAPHVALDGVLDDNKPAERETALALGLELLQRCDELWVFGSVISEGMAAEIDLAKRIGIPVKTVLFDSEYQKAPTCDYAGLTLGAIIKQARKRAKLTQEEVAEWMQLSKQAISAWEKDHRKPLPENIVDLLELLPIPKEVAFAVYCQPPKELLDIKTGCKEVLSYES